MLDLPSYTFRNWHAFGRTMTNLQTSPQPAHSLIGAVRRFGPHGVLYEVVRILDDQCALIRVIVDGLEPREPQSWMEN